MVSLYAALANQENSGRILDEPGLQQLTSNMYPNSNTIDGGLDCLEQDGRSQMANTSFYSCAMAPGNLKTNHAKTNKFSSAST